MSAFQASSPSDPQVDQVDELIRELKVFGGYVNESVKVKEDPNSGNGIFADSDIAEGSILVSVPFALCISMDAITSYGPLAAIFEDNPGLLEYQDEVLAIGLMYSKLSIESGGALDATPWSRHVNTMPLQVDTPLFWSDAEIEKLRPSNVYHLTKLLKRTIENDWASLHKPLSTQYPCIANITLDHYKWALSMVYSRAFGFQRSSGEYVRCIVPVLDMANHNPDAAASAEQAFCYEDASNTVKLICPRFTKAGEECFAFYGTYPNGKLLFTYGFTIIGCRHRAIDLWTRVGPSTTCGELKNRILNGNPLTNNQTYDFKGTISDNYVSPSLLATIRVIQSTEEELQYVENAFKGKMISIRNELASYKALRELVVARMNPAEAELDRKTLGELLLNGTPANDRTVMALVVKADERSLLQDIIPVIDSWSAKLAELGDAYIPPDSAK